MRQEKDTKFAAFRMRIANRFWQYISDNRTTLPAWNESNFAKLGYESPITGRRYVDGITLGYRLGVMSDQGNDECFGDKELERLVLLFSAMGLGDGDPLFVEAREVLPGFSLVQETVLGNYGRVKTSDLLERVRTSASGLVDEFQLLRDNGNGISPPDRIRFIADLEYAQKVLETCAKRLERYS